MNLATFTGQVVEFSASASGNATPTRTIPLTGIPFGVAVDGSGQVYVSSDTLQTNVLAQVLAFGVSSSTPVRTFTFTGNNTIVAGLQVDAAGNIYTLAQMSGTTSTFAIDKITSSQSGTGTPAAQMTSTVLSNPATFLSIR